MPAEHAENTEFRFGATYEEGPTIDAKEANASEQYNGPDPLETILLSVPSVLFRGQKSLPSSLPSMSPIPPLTRRATGTLFSRGLD